MRKEASFVSVATAIALVGSAVSGGMYMGALAADLAAVEKAVVQQKEDHDRLIKVETKIESIEEDVSETKTDVKAILQAINEMNRGT